MEKKTRKKWLLSLIFISMIVGGFTYYTFGLKPKNSLELYQALAFSDGFQHAQKLVLEGYEGSFTEEDFDYIRQGTANSVKQFTLIEFNEKTYIVMTTPGAERLKILSVTELPEDSKQFFSELE